MRCSGARAFRGRGVLATHERPAREVDLCTQTQTQREVVVGDVTYSGNELVDAGRKCEPAAELDAELDQVRHDGKTRQAATARRSPRAPHDVERRASARGAQRKQRSS